MLHCSPDFKHSRRKAFIMKRSNTMSKLSTLTPIAAVLAVSLSGVSQAASNPFATQALSAGTTLAAHHEAGKEGKCGEGKCGGNG
jgi:uncharacterized low-complexity protein